MAKTYQPEFAVSVDQIHNLLDDFAESSYLYHNENNSVF